MNPNAGDIGSMIQTLREHPQPPPEYFEGLRKRIMKKIEGPQSPQAASWLGRVAMHFDLSSAALGTAGVCVLALFISGMLVALQERPLYRPDQPLAPLELGPMASDLGAWFHVQAALAPKPAARPQPVPRSTEPVTSPETGSLIQSLPALQPVSYNGAPNPK